MAQLITLSRRVFLAAAGALGLATLGGCGGSSLGRDTQVDMSKMWHQSYRSRRASVAAKTHAANRCYPTPEAALADLPHAGANPRIVATDTSVQRWQQLFGGGAQVVDWRTL